MSITTTFISLDLTGFMRNGDYEPTVRASLKPQLLRAMPA
jgi:hypothetical protein